jgi:CheY-like chemotaxis protein
MLSGERDGAAFWLVSTIKDTGIGIRPDDLKKLFSDYNQVDIKSNRKIQGTGLGLSITKRMAEMMEGGITVESEYGKGTAFTMRIRQELVTDASTGAFKTIGSEVAAKLRSFSYSEHKRDRNAKLLRAYIPYAKVLVVDDVAVNLDVARGLMKPYGMQIDCVTSGPEAIALIREEKVKYNAIFMDHMMPGMDGIEATRIIREEIGSEYAKNIPIIALTANAIMGNEEMFLGKGFQAFLSKPIDIVAMDTAINRWVRDKTLEKELGVQSVEARSGKDRRTGDRRSGTDRRRSLAMPAGISGIPEAEWEAAGINVTSGLERFGGDTEGYVTVLKSYVKNTPELLDEIRACTQETIDNYRITVHGIKSASRSIGAEALGAQAEALESAAKEGRLDGINSINETNAGFIAEAEKLIGALAALLGKIESEHPKPLKAAPDRAALAALRDACASYDIDAVDRALESLESYRYESGAELVSWLREQANISEFSKIEERLAGELSAAGKSPPERVHDRRVGRDTDGLR